MYYNNQLIGRIKRLGILKECCDEKVVNMVWDDTDLCNLFSLFVSLSHGPPMHPGMEPTALIIFIPIFFFICVCNIGVHIFDLLTGVMGKTNLNFITVKSLTKKGLLKWGGLGFILLYTYDLYLGDVQINVYSIAWNILAIMVTLFYVMWFNSFRLKSQIS